MMNSLVMYASAVARSYAIAANGAHVKPEKGVLFAGVVNPRSKKGLAVAVMPFEQVFAAPEAFTVGSDGTARWKGTKQAETARACRACDVWYIPVNGLYTDADAFEIQAADAFRDYMPEFTVKHNPSGKRRNSRDIELWKGDKLVYLVEVKGRCGRMLCESKYIETEE